LFFFALITTFVRMNQVRRWLVWLSRIHCCRGFGIQSPTDYAFVRYVVNEHWPYYAYEELADSDWLTEKLGRLYFRLANWRQPSQMLSDGYQRYWQSGCNKVRFAAELDNVELARVDIEDDAQWQYLITRCNARSVIVVEGIWRRPGQWLTIMNSSQTGTTFDLYYCGIVFFDPKRCKQHYKINF